MFIDVGCRLFLNKGKQNVKFVTGHLIEPDEGAYQGGPLAHELTGRVVAIFASSLFHMPDYEDQLLFAKRMVAMCEDRMGVMITGRQLGSYLGGRYPMTGMREDGYKFKSCRHNEQTMRSFWHEVGKVTDTQWTVDTATYMGEEIEQIKNAPFAEPDVCMIGGVLHEKKKRGMLLRLQMLSSIIQCLSIARLVLFKS